MMMLVVALAVAGFVVAVALGAAVWTRRHRARRDFEGHFQHEWEDAPRWDDLSDGKSASEQGERTQGSG
jgi:hypothetical protein